MPVQRLGMIVNLVLIALIAYVIADLTTSVIDRNIAVASRPRPHALRSPTVTAPTAAHTDYSPVIDKNIFGSVTTDEPVDSDGPDIDPLAAQHTSLNLCLVGTAVSSRSDHSFASIQDLDTPNKDVRIFFVSDMIKTDVKLVKVDRQVVYFERLGFIEKLELCEEGKPRPVDTQSTAGIPGYSSPSAAPAYTPPPPPAMTGDNQFQLDRRTVDQHLGNLSTLLTQARVVPHFDKGKPNGFRIFSIRPDSLFEQIGLKNGDVLKKINSLNITSTEEALQAFTQLRSANRLSLELERDGSQTSLSYEIR